MFDIGIYIIIFGFLLIGIGRTLRKYYSPAPDEFFYQLRKPKKPYLWMKQPAKKKQIKK
jgi:hypothetical protein